MLKKELKFLASVLVLFLLFIGTSKYLQSSDDSWFSSDRFEKSCGMDCCNSGDFVCLLCTASSSAGLYIHKKTDYYSPIFPDSLISIDLNALSDQDFVKTICHPPTFIL
jgi:hypothetical protein